jgi:hypothetical protein
MDQGSDFDRDFRASEFCHVFHIDIAGLIAGIDSIEYVDD